MSDSGDVIKIDQEHLETVIPALGTMIYIVRFEVSLLTRSLAKYPYPTHERSLEIPGKGSQESKLIFNKEA